MPEITNRKDFNSSSRDEGLRPAALRALHFAQGQMVQAQQRDILYLMALVLEQLREDALGGFDIGRISPTAEKILPEISPYLDADARELEGAADYQVRNHLDKIGPALAEIIDFCNRHSNDRHEGIAFQQATNFGAAAASYLTMVQDVADGAQYGGAGDSGNFRRLARLDPFVTARFIGEYLLLAAFAVEGSRHEPELLDTRIRLMNAIKGPLPSIYEAKSKHIEQVMMMLSDASDVLLKTHKDLHSKISDQAPYKNVLKHLFQISAAYDWEQFESTSTARRERAPAKAQPKAKP